MYFDQDQYEVRFEWGLEGLRTLAPVSDAIIVVDVLSFSTCIDIAVGNGAIVFPYRWRDDSAASFARSKDAILASDKREAGYSLSPVSLLNIPRETRLVLPSPNGATLLLATGATPTFAGCLRNATAVAKAANQYGAIVSVIAAGERWSDGTLRPSIEDLFGAGAMIEELAGTLSPEAHLARAAFRHAKLNLTELLKTCGSGKELIARGFEPDVDLAAAFDTSQTVPILRDGAFQKT